MQQQRKEISRIAVLYRDYVFLAKMIGTNKPYISKDLLGYLETRLLVMAKELPLSLGDYRFNRHPIDPTDHERRPHI